MSGYEGCIHINAVIAVPAAREADGDALFVKHKAWVQSTHSSLGLLFYTVTKNKELSVPLDPSSEPTGRVIFSVNEIYTSPAGLMKHWGMAKTESGFFDEFVAFFTAEGSTVLAMHGAPVIHSLLPKDLPFPE